MIKPGLFGKTVAADAKRQDYDFDNEQLLYFKKDIDYLFLGDSITWHWNLNLYFNTKKSVVQRGIGGDNSTYLLKRFDADCIQLNPKTAVIMIGTNDIFRCDDDLWWKTKGEPVEEVLEEYRQNVRAMIKKCDEAGIEVILCSVIPSTIAPPFDREKRWYMTAKMNEFLKSCGKKYIDYTSALSDDGKNLSDELTPDGIHPNAAGYVKMTEILKREIDL